MISVPTSPEDLSNPNFPDRSLLASVNNRNAFQTINHQTFFFCLPLQAMEFGLIDGVLETEY